MRIQGKLIKRWVTEDGAYAEIEWTNPCIEVADKYFDVPCGNAWGTMIGASHECICQIIKEHTTHACMHGCGNWWPSQGKLE